MIIGIIILYIVGVFVGIILLNYMNQFKKHPLSKSDIIPLSLFSWGAIIIVSVSLIIVEFNNFLDKHIGASKQEEQLLIYQETAKALKSNLYIIKIEPEGFGLDVSFNEWNSDPLRVSSLRKYHLKKIKNPTVKTLIKHIKSKIPHEFL